MLVPIHNHIYFYLQQITTSYFFFIQLIINCSISSPQSHFEFSDSDQSSQKSDIMDAESTVGMVLNNPVNGDNTESLAPTLPRRLRRRLSESKNPTFSAEEIEAKLNNALLRRQKFYESLSTKALPKVRSGFSSSQEKYLGSESTTFSLAKSFEELQINQKSVKSIPFENLAVLLGSGDTIHIVKSLLQRIESHIITRHEENVNIGVENIDHLLKRVGSPGKKGHASRASSSTTLKEAGSRMDASQKSAKLCRYPADFVLAAYMVSSHPDAVSWGMGDYGIDLVSAADFFSQEFDSLVKIMLQTPIHSSEESCVPTASQLTFISQLEKFDKAWCSFLYQFVTWKENDAKLMGNKLVRAACRLEVTRMHNKLTSGGDHTEVTDMETLLDQLEKRNIQIEIDSASPGPGSKTDDHQSLDQMLVTENPVVVNELVHGHYSASADSLVGTNEDHGSINVTFQDQSFQNEIRVADIMNARQIESTVRTVLNIPVNGENAEFLTPKLPRRLRRRLTESKTATFSAEDIEVKLNNAHLRRQKFYESLSSKALPKLRSGFSSSQEKSVGSESTTFSLAKAFAELQINQNSVKSMPFENLAVLLGSGDTIRIVKSLLKRVESHIIIRHEENGDNGVENIDHLLKRVGSPGKKSDASRASSSITLKEAGSRKDASQKTAKLCRYPAYFVLGAYMVSSHPDVVSWGMGDYGIDLVRAAEVFSQEFDSLVKIMLQGPIHSSEESCVPTASQLTFISQLENFDKAWCSYLYHFVTWKENDAKLMGNKLVRAACRLEVTRMHYYNLSSGGDHTEVTDMKTLLDQLEKRNIQSEIDSASPGPGSKTDDHQSLDQMLVTENPVIVNELVHGHYSASADSLIASTEDHGSIKSIVRDTMEKAFWDGIMETLKQDVPDYSWVLKLMKEIQDELCQLSPSNWRQEIDQAIDLDTLSQALQMGTLDMEHCGRILEFSLVTLQKLSAPAKEDELKTAHQNLLRELAEISQVGEKNAASFALIVMKGLRFILQQIQALKHEVSKARISMLEPLIKGPAGFEYLRSSFANLYGSPADASTHLPIAKRWLSSVLIESEKNWNEYLDSLSLIKSTDGEHLKLFSPTTLRAGSTALRASALNATSSLAGAEQPECKGEKLDLLLRLGLLKLVSEVEGLTAERLPETFQLNLMRSRSIQSQLQKIIVISTSILILRQTLISEHLVTSALEMENVISDCVKRLSKLLDTVEDVGVPEIVEIMNCYPNNGDDSEKSQARKDLISNMLGKSLSAGDAVFSRVSCSVYLAARGIVLGGGGAQGKQLAETALKRIGASPLTQKLVDAVKGLVVMASVSKSVHEAWYEQVLRNI